MSGEVRTYVNVGDTVTVLLPYSEVCMHMRVAGRRMPVRLQASTYFNGEVVPGAAPVAQILNASGTEYSFPVLYGEAGFYRDSDGRYYTSELPAPRHLRLVGAA